MILLAWFIRGCTRDYGQKGIQQQSHAESNAIDKASSSLWNTSNPVHSHSCWQDRLGRDISYDPARATNDRLLTCPRHRRNIVFRAAGAIYLASRGVANYGRVSLAKDFAFQLVLVGARERNFGSWAPLSTANVLAMGLYRKLCAKHARC